MSDFVDKADAWDELVKKNARIAELETENASLRNTISGCADALPGLAVISPTATAEFMAFLPNEIRMTCAKIEARVATLEEALRPFVFSLRKSSKSIHEAWILEIKWDDYDRAARALKDTAGADR